MNTESDRRWRIAVVEDNKDVLETFCLAISASARCVLSQRCTRLSTATRELSNEPPDVVFVDLELPDGSGADLIRQLAQLEPAPQMIVYTSFSDEEHVFDALQAGANGYLLKQDVEPTRVDEFVSSVMRGESPMSGSIARRCIEHFRELRDDQGLDLLTQREYEVLAQFAQGKSTKQVAHVLEMSMANVKTRARSIYKKLKVHNRVDAVKRFLSGST